MKGCPLPDVTIRQKLKKETAMRTGSTVTQMGFDCHRNFSTLCARDGVSGRVVFRQRLEHADREKLRAQLRQLPAVPVVLEGSFGWGWMSDELTSAGQEPHLASTRKIAAWRKARGIAKSNRTDGDLLSELWNQQPRWWEVWLAPVEVRDQRELLRYRMGLVQIQTAVKNRIHATLHRHGIVNPHSDLFGATGRRWLSLLLGSTDEAQPPEAQPLLRTTALASMRGELILLDQVRRLIAKATREFRQEVNRSGAAGRLMTLPGISWVLAYTIAAEIGRIERFKTARHLVSYSLLAPIADDSGDETDDAPLGRHVGHAGRRTLKWAFIEAAHGAVRKGGRFRAIFDRRTDCGKRDRNRGYIAVANELCRLSYLLWKKQVNYSDSPPPRPGTMKQRTMEEKTKTSLNEKKKQRTSRPGTGQPDRAMAAADA
jgi:transposase